MMVLSNKDPLHVSHVSVLDVFSVHQHVVPAQCPHLALGCHHMALKHLAAVCVDMRRTNYIYAVLGERGHWLSESEEKNRGKHFKGWMKLILADSHGDRKTCFSHNKEMLLKNVLTFQSCFGQI